MKLHVDVHLKGYAQEKTSTQNGSVLLVTSSLSPLCGMLAECFDQVDAVRSLLQATFPGQVRETTFLGSRYIWIYNFETHEWERVCIDDLGFEVEFDGGDVVVVRVYEGGPYTVPREG